MSNWIIGFLLGILLFITFICVLDQFKENKICYFCQNEDVNRDGKVDAKDLLRVQKYIIGSDK